jgi:hypothetical protein
MSYKKYIVSLDRIVEYKVNRCYSCKWKHKLKNRPVTEQEKQKKAIYDRKRRTENIEKIRNQEREYKQNREKENPGIGSRKSVEYQRIAQENLLDSYIVRRLVRTSLFKELHMTAKDITPEMIEAKRRELQMIRELGLIPNVQKHKTWQRHVQKTPETSLQ